MKLIMENWRNTLSENEPQEPEQQRVFSPEDREEYYKGMTFRTLGDLRKAIQLAKSAKKSGKIVGKGKGAFTDTLWGLVGLGAKKTIVDMAKTAYRLPDDVETGAGLDLLNVDDQISYIVDDKIENAFLNSYLKEFEKLPDKTELDQLGATKRLINFIFDKFRRRITRPD